LTQLATTIVSYIPQRLLTWRMAMIALVAIALSVSVCAMVGSFMRGNGTLAERNRLERQVEAKRHEKEQLQKLKDWRRSPEGVADLARNRGMVASGEEALRFPPQTDILNATQVPLKTDTSSEAFGGWVLAALLLFALAFLTGIGLLLYRWQARRARRPAGMLTPRSELRRRGRHATHGI
jgi:cell division protein FtsB